MLRGGTCDKSKSEACGVNPVAKFVVFATPERRIEAAERHERPAANRKVAAQEVEARVSMSVFAHRLGHLLPPAAERHTEEIIPPHRGPEAAEPDDTIIGSMGRCVRAHDVGVRLDIVVQEQQ